jgi:tRNA-specific 2-thiouridylase
MKKKVVVGMSGGVDSSVAALLLKEQGYDVIGVTMQIWDAIDSTDEAACGGLSEAEDARQVAEIIGIPHYVVNFSKEFRRDVIDYFISDYLAGRTPNPCIACNRYIKWEALLHKAVSLGADYIATGHYGKITELPNGRYSVEKSEATGKDQSYVLYNLTQEELSHTLFPLSMMEKEDVRKIALDHNLPVAHKKDSQDICFVKDKDYAGFIERETGIKSRPGNFVDSRGNVLGTHTGIIHYTIGQRKGLGIAFGEPKYVIRLNPDTNEVVLGDHDELMTYEVYVDRVNYMSVESITEPTRVTGKIRYAAKDTPCTIYPEENGRIKAVFDEAVRAVTPGQAAVFYDGNNIICGGIII